MTTRPLQPHELLDDGFTPPSCEVLVIGCGNILRGDDAVGPILIRHLWQVGVPDSVRLADGGTAGMDVAFQMRGARKVVIVDASTTEAPAGTIYRVPGEELANTPPLTGLHTHSFRWDHALSFSRWLLGPECPTDVTVFLIEAGDLTPGAELSPPVRQAMKQVAVLIQREFLDSLEAPVKFVEITADGYLRMTADIASRYFPADVCGAVHEEGALLLVPLQSQANGGQLLKQRNAAGDRCLLIREVLADQYPIGQYQVRWDDTRGVLVVDLDQGL